MPKYFKKEVVLENGEYVIKDIEITTSEIREKEYLLLGITKEKMIIDLWERVVENRPEASEATQALRVGVKQKFPKV